VNPAAGKGNPVAYSMLAVLGFGIMLPLAQWIILRQWLPNTYWWLVASLIGFGLGLVIDLIMSYLGIYPIRAVSTLGSSIVFGLVIGTAQWTYLRRHLPNSVLWIFASALGWGLMTVTTGMDIDGLLEQILFGLIPALCTGLSLVYLLYVSSRESPNVRGITA
jgi:hypothetical protein